MFPHGLRFLICLAVVLGNVGGCKGVPPVPHGAATAPEPPSTGDPYDADRGGGWLFDGLSGRDSSPTSSGAPDGVVPVSATEPISPAPVQLPKKDSGLKLSDFSPDNIGKTVKELTGQGPNEGVAQALFEEGDGLFRERQFSAAAERFEKAAKRWPDSPMEEDALFLAGESYFFSDRYPQAQDTYDNLLKKYDNSRYLDTASKRLFAIGQYWEDVHRKQQHWPVTPNFTDKKQPMFDTFGNAVKAYEAVLQRDPRGPLADDAVMAIANGYFNKGRYEDAAYHYDMLRTEYPSSEHQQAAHVLAVQSKLRVYQGEEYDRTPLDDADDVAAQALTQFRSQLGEEQDRLAETRDRIVEEKAKRDWAMARYYENQNQYGAARFYYQSIIKDYPLSQHARLARSRLEEIRGEPDEPPDRFGWLNKVLPSRN
ncbi:MAG TPA: tetratricopeptide repeat protein [Thermoguttaceae bacterium]|nr:tetratricopeptide repeat protein [Thermoguttaceae bacterium]